MRSASVSARPQVGRAGQAMDQRRTGLRSSSRVTPCARRTAVISARSPGAISCRMMSRSEEHTSELQSLMRISYAVFCLKKKQITHKHRITIAASEQKNEYNTY